MNMITRMFRRRQGWAYIQRGRMFLFLPRMSADKKPDTGGTTDYTDGHGYFGAAATAFIRAHPCNLWSKKSGPIDFLSALIRVIRGKIKARYLLLPLFACLTVSASAAEFEEDDFFDHLGEALSLNAFSNQVRARLSGTLDLEGYSFSQPPPGVIDAPGHALFTPRLSVFLDGQIGEHIYVFAQTRVDRGFDPENDALEARLDEYAVRFTPWHDGRFSLQLGKFATTVGNWVPRHGSWENPFITAPLPYENLTGIWDSEAVRTSTSLLQWAHVRPGLPAAVTAIEKSRRLPIIWGPEYTTGVAASGRVEHFSYTLEVKNAALSSRPYDWSPGQVEWSHPSFGGRFGWRPDARWNFGFSASEGSYLEPIATRTPAPGYGRGAYREEVIGQDIGFAWHHLQLWSEIYAARFAIPTIGHADTLAYYVEGKYKFTPRFFGSLRWNQQLFGTIPDRGTDVRWGHNVWRIDVAPGWRLSAHLQWKFQYSLQHGNQAGNTLDHEFATQLTVRF